MAHASLLGVHVKLVIAVGGHLDGHILDHLQAVALESHALDRVVSHQTHLGHAKDAQDVGAYTIVTLIRLKAQMYVGINGIQTVFLQFIGLDLVHQTDTAALLVHIDHKAFAFFLNHLHRHVQLLAAFTAHRAEDIARCT